MKKLKKWPARIVMAFLFLYLILLIPDFSKNKVIEAGKKPFAWNKDEQWKLLEANFVKAKRADAVILDSNIHTLFNKLEKQFEEIKNISPEVKDSFLYNLLPDFFMLSSYVAVETKYKDSLINYYNKVRNAIKYQSRLWDVNDLARRSFNYQVIYGINA